MDPYYRNSGHGQGRGRSNPKHQQHHNQWGGPGRGRHGGIDDYEYEQYEGPSRHNRPNSRNSYIPPPQKSPHYHQPHHGQAQYGGHGRGHGGRRDYDLDGSSYMGPGPGPYATTSNSAGNIHPYPVDPRDRSGGEYRSSKSSLLIDPSGLGSPKPLISPATSSGYGANQVKPLPNRHGVLVPPLGTGAPERTPNDCEVIVLGKGQQNYAERVENSIRDLGLTVDLMFPNVKDVKFSAFIENIANMGSTFAVVIKNENENHRSVSVHVLKGPPKPEEHRNMPLATAYALIKDRFTELKRKELSLIPEPVKKSISLIMDDRFLTDHEYQGVIHYVQDRWQKQRAYEKRVDFDSGTGISSQDELKGRILKIVGLRKDGTDGGDKNMLQLQPPPAPRLYDNPRVVNYGHATQPQYY